MKKIAKVAVGKSMAPDVSAARRRRVTPAAEGGPEGVPPMEVEQRVVAVRGEPRAVVGDTSAARRRIGAVDERVAFALGA